jgi:hypothetical protein
VAISGSSSSAESRIWVNEVNPGERLQILHEWFTERLALVSRRGREQGPARADLLSLVQEIAPEAEVYERFRVLSDLLLPKEEGIRKLYLSTEHYAFHLPWAGAVAACTGGDPGLTVSIVPSSAFVTSGRRLEHPNRSSIIGAIYFDDSDPMLELAAEQIRTNIYADSDGDQSWTVEMLTDSTPADSATSPGTIDLDLVIVLSHGSQASGISSDRLAASLRRKARCVLLLGCWSATVTQDNRHMEIEGTVTQFLEFGVQAVVASVWPVPAFAAIQFGSAFAIAMESCTDPATTFSAAVQVLRLGGGARLGRLCPVRVIQSQLSTPVASRGRRCHGYGNQSLDRLVGRRYEVRSAESRNSAVKTHWPFGALRSQLPLSQMVESSRRLPLRQE